MKRAHLLSDEEVLEQAGNFGPGIIGQELYDRACEVRKRTSGGLFGPAIVGDKTASALEADAWEDWTRAEMLAFARDASTEIKGTATRAEIIAALAAAGLEPPKA